MENPVISSENNFLQNIVIEGQEQLLLLTFSDASYLCTLFSKIVRNFCRLSVMPIQKNEH